MYHPVWYFTVTIETIAINQIIMITGYQWHHKFFGDSLFMTTDAVLLDQRPCFLLHDDILPFHSEGELCCMVKPIGRFKEIFPDDIIMRYMTIIACYCAAMRRVRPIGILRNHHVTIDAGHRFITQV